MRAELCFIAIIVILISTTYNNRSKRKYWEKEVEANKSIWILVCPLEGVEVFCLLTQSSIASSYAPAWPFTHKHPLSLLGAWTDRLPPWVTHAGAAELCSCRSPLWWSTSWAPWSGHFHGTRQQLWSSNRRSRFSGRSHAKKYVYFLGIDHTEDKMVFLLADVNVWGH